MAKLCPWYQAVFGEQSPICATPDGHRREDPRHTPRSRARRQDSDDPPGRPRLPRLNAASIASQVSPVSSGTGPMSRWGQCPVRA